MSFVIFLFIYFIQISGINCKVPFIKACNTSDSQCVKTSAQRAVPVFADGIKDHGVEVLDPMLVSQVSSDTTSWKVTFRDTVVKGLKDSKIKDVRIHIKNQKLLIQVLCSVTMRGAYQLNGRLLLVPVSGKGPYVIVIRDMEVEVDAQLKLIKRNNKQYVEIYKWQHNYKVKGGVKFDFKNLSNTVVRYMNNNWRQVMSDIAPPMVEAIVTKVVDAVTSFFKTEPLEEIIFDY